jgi:Ras-related protein Rab-8A
LFLQFSLKSLNITVVGEKWNFPNESLFLLLQQVDNYYHPIAKAARTQGMSSSNVAQGGDSKIKFIIIGDSSTGKSSLLIRFTDNKFSPSFITTIGIDFRQKVIQLNNQPITLQVWDTAGCERFRSITSAYYRGAQVVLLVFDVGSAQSFANVKGWLNSINEQVSDAALVWLVGNKCDLEERAVTKDQAKELAASFKISYTETSARTGENVEELFTSAAKQFLSVSGQSSSKPTVELDPPNRKSCCR